MPPRVTQRDVAKAMGISKSTVAAAFASGTISEVTKKHVLDTAEKMGYKPDPVLSSLGRSRWGKTSTRSTYSLAFVSSEPHTFVADQKILFPVALQVAERLGYSMEFHHVKDYDSCEQLGHILYNRGVRGLLVSFPFQPPPQPDFDWSLFSAVSLKEGPYTPPIHRVGIAYFQATLMAWKKTVDAGYRRIGGVLQIHEPVLSDDSQRMGAFANAQQLYLQPSEYIPPFFYGVAELENPKASSKKVADKQEEWFVQFAQWFNKYQPEAVIGSNTLIAWWIQRLGKQIPQDVAFVTLIKESKHTDFAGMLYPKLEPAKTAVPFLDMLIRTNQRGLPDDIQYVSYSSKWQDGPSLPKKKVVSVNR